MSANMPEVRQRGPEHWEVTYAATTLVTVSFWDEDAAKRFAADVRASDEIRSDPDAQV